jgi:hypothetical protein
MVMFTIKNEYSILTSIDGPYNNVIVIKPPMVFSRNDAKYLLDCIQKALQHDLLKTCDLSTILLNDKNMNDKANHTPT